MCVSQQDTHREHTDDPTELQSLIEVFFIQRKSDEAELVALVNGIVSLPGKCGRTLQSGTGRLCVRPVVDLFPDMNN